MSFSGGRAAAHLVVSVVPVLVVVSLIPVAAAAAVLDAVPVAAVATSVVSLSRELLTGLTEVQPGPFKQPCATSLAASQLATNLKTGGGHSQRRRQRAALPRLVLLQEGARSVWVRRYSATAGTRAWRARDADT